MNIKEIRQLMSALENSKLDRLEWQEGESKLVLTRREESVHAYHQAYAPMRSAHEISAPTVPEMNTKSVVPAQEEVSHLVYVTSPIVGTYYAAPAPGEPAFVRVGDRVKVGDVVCIIEAMKLMNEIKSQEEGLVVEVLVDNEEGVAYGQKIVAIDPTA